MVTAETATDDHTFRMLIGGDLVAGTRSSEVVNPATWEPVGIAPRASVDQVNAAVGAAERAFPSWASMPADARAQRMHEAADRIEANVVTLARLLTREGGLPIRHSVPEVEGMVASLRHFADLRLEPAVLEDSAVRHAWIENKPLGPVAIITPWNFPIDTLAVKLPPALASGCTVVVKPAGTTPLTTLLIAELVSEIFPAGVVNVVSDDNDLGPALTNSQGIAKISFTGSTQTGGRVMESASHGIRPVTLELGGNDAAVILSDADPAEIADEIFNGAFRHSGQSCMAIKRIYVHSSIADELTEEMVKRADQAVLGDGLDDATTHGPLQNQVQYDKSLAFLHEATIKGRVLSGGGATPGVGWWMRPTVVRDLPDDARVVSDEQFCPVVPVLTFDTDEELIPRVNNTVFGLGASIWTRDAAHGVAIAREIEAGTVWINKRGDVAPHLPIRGAKQSGLGVELGPTALKEFMQEQLINEPSRQGGP
jgi:acyl-CoA reductase-like NAD-dependent aldehyde dehydrogenase